MCFVLSELCEAYGGWPSERMGIFDRSRPDTYVVAMAFDTDVLSTARKVSKRMMDEATKEKEPAKPVKDIGRLKDLAAKLPEGSQLKAQLEGMIRAG